MSAFRFFSAQDTQSVGKCGKDTFQIFFDCFWAARKIYDQRALPYDRNSPA